MTLRRALWASPLAVSVAVLAHLVAFGFLHAPGAGNAPGLLWTLAVTLAFGLAGAFAGGASGAPRRSIATKAPSVYAPLLLAAAGVLGFGVIELSEGHVALGTLLQAALASLPIAYLVSFAARSARGVARDAGVRYAAFAGRTSRSRAAGIAYRDRRATFVVAQVLGCGNDRGRAPPLPV